MQPPRLGEHMDEAASELAADPEETYEVALAPASAADDCLADATLGGAAADLRDTFGTWAQRIHSHGHPDGSTLEEAEAAHRDIEAAVTDWGDGGRDDPAAFASRWRRTIEPIDITWLGEGVAWNVRDQIQTPQGAPTAQSLETLMSERPVPRKAVATDSPP